MQGLKFGCHSATIMVKTVPGKNRQCILNLGGNFEKEEDVCMTLKCLVPPGCCWMQEDAPMGRTGQTRPPLLRTCEKPAGEAALGRLASSF